MTTRKLVEGLAKDGLNVRTLTLSSSLPSTERNKVLRRMPPLIRLMFSELNVVREDLGLCQHYIDEFIPLLNSTTTPEIE
jgi:hypothetical protein